MKFTRETAGNLTVQSVTAAAITINGEPYAQTVAMTREEILSDWIETPVAELAAADFETLLASSPEIVLLGTGSRNIFPPRELTFAFARRGVGLECMNTAAAARTFNVLSSEGRQVAAVLYL